MRKVMLGMNVSLDGYVATTDGALDWAFANFDDELFASAMDSISQLDTMLIGRVNYGEQAAAWQGHWCGRWREAGAVAVAAEVDR